MKRMVDLTIKNNKVTAIDGYEVGTKPTFSMKPFFEAGGKMGYSDATSLEGFWEKSDTSNVTNMNSMFQYCSNLTSIPEMDTSNVTNMNAMFYECKNLTSIPEMDTSNVTNMNSMFQYCSNLTSIPEMDTSNVTGMRLMFGNCKYLTSIPMMDTSKVTDMWGMFNNCSNLTSIPMMDISKVTQVDQMFYGCAALAEIHMINICVSLNISYSTKFTRSALLEIIGNLKRVTENKTLTMGSTNLAKLTDEDKKIATDKGWILA